MALTNLDKVRDGTGREGSSALTVQPFDDEYPSFGVQPNSRHFDMPKQVEIAFGDIFETPAVHRSTKFAKSVNGAVINKAYKCIFTYTLDITYYTFAVIIGFILTLVWGIIFGLVNFIVIWAIQPCLKTHYLVVRIAGSAYTACIRTFFDPIFQSFGLCFSYFRLRLNFLLPPNFPGVPNPLAKDNNRV